MRLLKMLVGCVAALLVVSIAVSSQSRGPSGAVLYEGGRLIVGDGSAPIEGGAFVVQNGRINAIGRPAGIGGSGTGHSQHARYVIAVGLDPRDERSA